MTPPRHPAASSIGPSSDSRRCSSFSQGRPAQFSLGAPSLSPSATKTAAVGSESVNEGVDEHHTRIVRADIVVHRLRQQRSWSRSAIRRGESCAIPSTLANAPPESTQRDFPGIACCQTFDWLRAPFCRPLRWRRTGGKDALARTLRRGLRSPRRVIPFAPAKEAALAFFSQSSVISRQRPRQANQRRRRVRRRRGGLSRKTGWQEKKNGWRNTYALPQL